MNLPKAESYNDGLLSGTIYRFINVNDCLELHTHDYDTVHITFVISGEIKITGPSEDDQPDWEVTYGPGGFISFEIDQLHQITSTKENTVILNLLKNHK